ncbi:hypothetical protein MTO96_046999 [Rhipicephalus appendiculatus]
MAKFKAGYTKVLTASILCHGANIDEKMALACAMASSMAEPVRNGRRNPTGRPKNRCGWRSWSGWMGTPETVKVVGLIPTGVAPHMCSDEHFAGLRARPRGVARASTRFMRSWSRAGESASGVRSSA